MSFIDRFKEPPERSRSLPFWSLNDKLEEKEIRRQVREMADAGHGGFFMHARDGLLTPYMSDEWFDAIRAAAEEAEDAGILAYCYDEEGWPSGSAGGKVIAEHPEFGWRWLRIREANDTSGGEILHRFVKDGRDLCVVAFTGDDYIDVLDPEAVKAFIEKTHEEYLSRLGDLFSRGLIGGFFTDEPQYALCRVPWTPRAAGLFSERYGYSLPDRLPSLFFDAPGCEKIRFDFWGMINDLFCESFGKTIYDWCDSHGIELTGHAMMEDNLLCQMHCTGGVMPFYEYMHTPGIDWLGRMPHKERITGRYCLPVTPLQLGSVASQLGKQRAISETFALCGWDVSFAEMKWLADWQFMYGVNLLCEHLEGYTIRGKRKCDYPPSVFYQSPWWDDYRFFADTVAREGAMLSSGKWDPDVLVLHPIHSVYLRFNGTDINSEQSFDDEFNLAVLALCDAHVDFHFGDERIMKRHGSVKDGALAVGENEYHTVILPSLYGLDRTTFDLLTAFVEGGGLLVTLGTPPEFIDGVLREDELSALLSRAVPCERSADAIRAFSEERGFRCANISGQDGAGEFIHVTARSFPDDGVKIYCLLNTSPDESFEIAFSAPGTSAEEYFPDKAESEVLCRSADDGKISLKLRFAPMQSRFVTVSLNEEAADEPQSDGYEIITLPDEWTVGDGTDENSYMIENCRVIRPGEKPTEQKHVYFTGKNIFSGAPENASAEFTFFVDKDADLRRLIGMKIVTEQKANVRVTLNGTPLEATPGEVFLDRSFTVYSSAGNVRAGENVISLSGFRDRDEDELGYVYLTGDFGVFSESAFVDAPNRAETTDGPFYLADRPQTVTGDDIVRQGYPFFRGKFRFETVVTVTDPYRRLFVVIPRFRGALVRVFVNGADAGIVAWGDRTCEITEYVREGENVLVLELCVGNRNLLGPHHTKEPEPMSVGPDDFYPYSPDKMRKTFAFVRSGLGPGRDQKKRG